ncbi:hypothetical protein OF83DRAFT_1084329 [Amylostereum chailletii]|nr:hypothetical protein OF83DRAFT_1084329 [Amylostereum chailletii]
MDADWPVPMAGKLSPKDVLESLKLDLQWDASNRDYRSRHSDRDEKPALSKYDQDYRDVKVEPKEVMADRFWTKYFDWNKKYDKEQIEKWKGDADGILIFTGLFSATVAAFIVESYKGLEPDSGDATVVLLSQLVGAIVNDTQPSTSPSPAFSAPRTIIDVNVLWFFSLILSLTCALGVTLVQQWTRNYSQVVFDEHATPRERGRLRAFLFAGVKRFRLPTVTSALPFLLHISVFLFFSGIVEFLWPINRALSIFTLAIVGIVGSIYAILTILPLFILDCPYHTPLTPAVWPFASVITKIRDLLRPTSPAELTSRERLRNFLGIFRSLYSSSYQSLDEFLHDRRSGSRAFGASDVDAVLEATVRIRDYTFQDSENEFAEELPAVVGCAPAPPAGAQALFQRRTDIDRIYAIPESLLFDQCHFGSAANLDRSSVILVKLLSCLHLANFRTLAYSNISTSLPLEVRRAVPNILKSMPVISGSDSFDLDQYRLADVVHNLSCHESKDTAVSARGAFGLAVVAALQNYLSQESNVENIITSDIPTGPRVHRILDAVFSCRARMGTHFIADEESSMVNGPCLAALCVLSDLLDDGEEEPYWSFRRSYHAHLHTLALLSTLSPYVGDTQPEVRAEFMHTWEELKAQTLVDAHEYDTARKKIIVGLLKPLYDALQAAQGIFHRRSHRYLWNGTRTDKISR